MSDRQGKANAGAWKAAEYVPDPYGPDAPVPETWTPDHVARRLIEAFRIDRRLPRIERPKAPGSAHPTMEYSREEKEIWETVEIDPKRFSPTPAEIAAMETAFGWLRFVRESDADGIAALRVWCFRMMAKEITRKKSVYSMRSVASKMGLHVTTLLQRKERALSSIASRLCMEKEPVW